MGAKASTAGNQSPRTFSNSSSSDVVSGNNATSFNFLRTAINGVDSVSTTGDSRQRARSMSAMPDLDIPHPATTSSNVNSSTSNHNNNNVNYHNLHHNHNHHHHHHHHLPQNAFSQVLNGFPHAGAGAHFDLSNSPEESNSHDESGQVHPLGIGRVVATSLPSHIWSLNGE